MTAAIQEGDLILRAWDEGGYSESTHQFATLQELFDLCLQVEDPKLIDRILIHGVSDAGKKHSLAFKFQSITRYKPQPEG